MINVHGTFMENSNLYAAKFLRFNNLTHSETQVQQIHHTSLCFKTTIRSLQSHSKILGLGTALTQDLRNEVSRFEHFRKTGIVLKVSYFGVDVVNCSGVLPFYWDFALLMVFAVPLEDFTGFRVAYGVISMISCGVSPLFFGVWCIEIC